ncbi:MAG: archaetidylserine decarboxylase [Woeseia sp.]
MNRSLIANLTAKSFLLLQRLVPQHRLTALAGWLAGIRIRIVKDFLIRAFVRFYDVDLGDVSRTVPGGFVDFNDFFTRELADGARPIDAFATSIVSPVDGIMSAAGRIEGDSLLQAKGIHYTLEDLLATDLADAALFENGSFATMYLAPYNYHRVHSPLGGELTAARYVHGRLFSVNRTTVGLLPHLFTKNERLICHFRTVVGPMALIFVGALNVGSVSTPWTGRIHVRKAGGVDDLDLDTAVTSVDVDKGQLLGWFNMGSTVIVLLPPGTCAWREGLASGARLRVGEAIGKLAVNETG